MIVVYLISCIDWYNSMLWWHACLVYIGVHMTVEWPGDSKYHTQLLLTKWLTLQLSMPSAPPKVLLKLDSGHLILRPCPLVWVVDIMTCHKQGLWRMINWNAPKNCVLFLYVCLFFDEWSLQLKDWEYCMLWWWDCDAHVGGQITLEWIVVKPRVCVQGNITRFCKPINWPYKVPSIWSSDQLWICHTLKMQWAPFFKKQTDPDPPVTYQSLNHV